MKFFNYIVTLFSKVPVYLRGMVIFVIIVAISSVVNRFYGRGYYTPTYDNYRPETIKLDNGNLINMDDSPSDLSEKTTIDVENNTVNVKVKENTKSAPNLRNNKNMAAEKALSDFEYDYSFGSPSADIVIIEYSSFQCPYCLRFYEGSMDQIKKNYIDTGKVRYVKRMIVQKNTLPGVMLPYCAKDENRYALVGDLYKNVDSWTNTARQKRELEKIALRNGFTSATFNSCIRDEKLANRLLQKQNTEARELRINSTPTFFINGERATGNMSYRDFSKKIDAELAKVKK